MSTPQANSLSLQATAVVLDSRVPTKWDATKAALAPHVAPLKVNAVGAVTRERWSAGGSSRKTQLRHAAVGVGIVVFGWDPGSNHEIDKLAGGLLAEVGLDSAVVLAPIGSASKRQVRVVYTTPTTPIDWHTLLGVTPIVKTTSGPQQQALPTPAPAPKVTKPPANLAIDDRVWQMIRTAVRNASGVLLVGPPGTGKTTLIDRIVAEATADPGAWNLSAAPAKPMTRTPDESWTTQDLVGGMTLRAQGLRWEPGDLVHALAEDRWLVLDELNRGDMDRVFGPIFSWLSGADDVEIGRTGDAGSGGAITLGWTDTPKGIADLDDLESDDEARLTAGSDWRLLGTYNATDAARVFRIGQALGRRFIRVPIPPPTPDKLRAFFATENPTADPIALDVVCALYAAHLSSSFPLGPAIFVRLVELLDDRDLLDDDPRDDQDSLADCYLLAAAAWLAKLPDEAMASLRADGEAHIATTGNSANILEDEQWAWLQDMSRHVA